MTHFRHHHQDAFRSVTGDAVGHGELVGDRAEGVTQLLRVGLALADERGAQEQLSTGRIVELLVLDDVAAILEQERGHGVHDAGSFLTAQGQDVGLRHGAS